MIWKTPDVKPDNDNDIVIISDSACFIGRFDDFHGFYISHSNGGIYGTEDIDRWAHLTDLTAVADRAEKLEEENQAMRDEFELWQYHHQVALDRAERLQIQNSVLLNYLMDFMHREKEYVTQYKTAKSVSTINGYHKRIKDHLHEIGIDD